MEFLEGATRDQRDDEVRRTADLVLGAACHTMALTGARRRVETGMSRREHARVLEALDLAALEASVNRILEEVVQPHLPRGPVDVAVDLNPLPYHGKPFRDPEELSQGEAREGTTWFHRYATLYVVARRRRYTLAVRFVRGSETATEALKPLLREAMARGVRPRIVYADKAFCTSKPWGGWRTTWRASSSPCP
jgi:hypothetical protein